MKRTLAIGCAAVALAAFAGTASAQTKFDVVVGGDALFTGGWVVDEDTDGGRNVEFNNRFRLVITPTAKADNGLEYGARLRLRTGSNGVVFHDRAFMFVNGGFGSVQLGTTYGLSDDYGIIGPVVDGIAGSWDDQAPGYIGGLPTGNTVGTALRNPLSSTPLTRAIYLTPNFGGFQAGVSYAPQDDNGTSIDRNPAGVNDIVEVGGSYSGTFGSFTVAASGYYEWANTDGPAENIKSWTVGTTVGFGPVAIGGMYTDMGDLTGVGGGTDATAWSVNGTYTVGPVILAGSFLRADEENVFVGGVDDKLDVWEAGVTYTIAPGLTAGVEYGYYDRNAAAGGDSHLVVFDTRLAF
ncbi:porin [Azospirillum sp. SYSU D00513]|uniref:porin n=1 Tax=Azospirillum sp. SYSU D00513 TaxID=2812561 RepID=UPI001A95AF5D|nr:porin [Azospirillum sp. SYSU D00513]